MFIFLTLTSSHYVILRVFDLNRGIFSSGNCFFEKSWGKHEEKDKHPPSLIHLVKGQMSEKVRQQPKHRHTHPHTSQQQAIRLQRPWGGQEVLEGQWKGAKSGDERVKLCHHVWLKDDYLQSKGGLGTFEQQLCLENQLFLADAGKPWREWPLATPPGDPAALEVVIHLCCATLMSPSRERGRLSGPMGHSRRPQVSRAEWS